MISTLQKFANPVITQAMDWLRVLAAPLQRTTQTKDKMNACNVLKPTQLLKLGRQ